MATYKEIHGTNIEVVSSDPSNPVEGQVWYNTTSNDLKGQALTVAGAWATTGSLNQANKIIDLNFYLGIGGVVTFKNGKISEFLNEIPIDKIVLETDSPYLAPVPHRGKRNESSYVELVAKKIAEVYDVDLEYVSEITDKNALDIFGI